MANLLYSTTNYMAFATRGGGMILRQVSTQEEVFIQPGDAANEILNNIAAIEDEVVPVKRDTIFDIVAQGCF
jgi:hypothetical protein